MTHQHIRGTTDGTIFYTYGSGYCLLVPWGFLDTPLHQAQHLRGTGQCATERGHADLTRRGKDQDEPVAPKVDVMSGEERGLLALLGVYSICLIAAWELAQYLWSLL